MNARESIAYFESIGLALRPSTARHQRWALTTAGDDDVFHFASLSQLWVFFKDVWALEHFQEAWVAEKVISEIMKDPSAAMIVAKSWAHGATDRISEVELNFWDKAPRKTECFSRSWRTVYAKLIKPYGDPEHPIYGRILHEHMLALLAEEPASYRHPLNENEYVDGYQAVDR
jgi:hypothetical protein